MSEMYYEMYAPDRYYRLAAEDIRKLITLEVAKARGEVEVGLRPAGDPWAVLELIDVVGINDVGILVFFRLPQTGSRVNVYVADVCSVADLERARETIEAGGIVSRSLQGYDVFDDHFIFYFPRFALHGDDVMSVTWKQFFAINAESVEGT